MAQEMAAWLRHYFPEIRPSGEWGSDLCWIAYMMTRGPEHNPPVYWLGRALDAVAEGGLEAMIRARLHAMHGAASCGGDRERDERVQDVLSEACAYAWSAAHLGSARFEAVGEPASLEHGPVRLRAAAHDVCVAPRRIRPQRTLEALIRAVDAHAEDAACRLGEAVWGICYFDTWYDPGYAQGVGYRLELTEPLRQAVRRATADRGIGYVLTRPFEWGKPLDAWY